MADGLQYSDLHTKVVVQLDRTLLYDGDLGATLWWMTLVVGSCVNVALILSRLASVKDPYPRKMTYLAAVFVFGCAVRSIWPRVDVERICFWDSWISVTFVGRVLATAAEVCFAAQISGTVGMLAQNIGFSRTKRVADVLFWFICIAQCCCWLGVTSRRQIWHVFEESIWAAVFGTFGVCYAVIYKTARTQVQGSPCSLSDVGYAKRYLAGGVPACMAFVVFMVLVDIPMYMHRYQQDQARGQTYLWVSEGVIDTMTCKRVSKSMEDWLPEIPWMTGYFLGSTLVSIWLTWGPEFKRKVE